MSASRLRSLSLTAIFALLACSKGANAPTPAVPTPTATPAADAPTAGASTKGGAQAAAGGYTYCKSVCAKLTTCKDIKFSTGSCEDGCKNDMNTSPGVAVAHFQCALAGKSCADYVACFDNDDPAFPSDDERTTACTKYCKVTDDTCKDRFGAPSPSCVSDCRGSFRTRDWRVAYALTLCTVASQSCDEASACTSILDSAGSGPSSPSNDSTPHAPSAPSKKACSNLGDQCVSDKDCCGSSARVRCWGGHCASR